MIERRRGLSLPKKKKKEREEGFVHIAWVKMWSEAMGNDLIGKRPLEVPWVFPMASWSDVLLEVKHALVGSSRLVKD